MNTRPKALLAIATVLLLLGSVPVTQGALDLLPSRVGGSAAAPPSSAAATADAPVVPGSSISRTVEHREVGGLSVTMETWVSALTPPCDPISFCQVCIATTIAKCIGEGGKHAQGFCEVTNDKCRCAFECTGNGLIAD